MRSGENRRTAKQRDQQQNKSRVLRGLGLLYQNFSQIEIGVIRLAVVQGRRTTFLFLNASKMSAFFSSSFQLVCSG